MSEPEGRGMLLGRRTAGSETYAPELLYPISRAAGRSALGCSDQLPFTGADLWHAYEMSWLNAEGKPVVKVGRFLVPAGSPFMVESKSFKLYLNSLNSTRFASAGEARATILRDISATVGTAIELELFDVDDASLAGSRLAGLCLDQLAVAAPEVQPGPNLLAVHCSQITEERLYTHLLRSLCPVTGQPDWASVWLHYRGMALDRNSLLRYIIAYRRHQEFHEQCVERMFCDIHRTVSPEFLHIQAFYTRRGGLDINPFRSTEPGARPLSRLDRQ
jgi:7-cyano-7-deazaguanine reductase